MIQKAILQIDCAKGVKKGSAAGSRFQAQNSVAAEAAKKLKQGASDKLQNSGASQGRAAASVKNGMLTVQYNPASIKYHAATSAQKTQSQDVGAATENVVSISRISTVDMSFELVFHNADDTDESVRDQMELVMNMIYDSPTKKVKFAWGKLETEGKLTSFSGEYDMFDEAGRPISGHMNLTIRTTMQVKQVERTLDKLDDERKDDERKNQ